MDTSSPPLARDGGSLPRGGEMLSRRRLSVTQAASPHSWVLNFPNSLRLLLLRRALAKKIKKGGEFLFPEQIDLIKAV